MTVSKGVSEILILFGKRDDNARREDVFFLVAKNRANGKEVEGTIIVVEEKDVIVIIKLGEIVAVSVELEEIIRELQQKTEEEARLGGTSIVGNFKVRIETNRNCGEVRVNHSRQIQTVILICQVGTFRNRIETYFLDVTPTVVLDCIVDIKNYKKCRRYRVRGLNKKRILVYGQ